MKQIEVHTNLNRSSPHPTLLVQLRKQAKVGPTDSSAATETVADPRTESSATAGPLAPTFAPEPRRARSFLTAPRFGSSRSVRGLAASGAVEDDEELSSDSDFEDEDEDEDEDEEVDVEDTGARRAVKTRAPLSADDMERRPGQGLRPKWAKKALEPKAVCLGSLRSSPSFFHTT